MIVTFNPSDNQPLRAVTALDQFRNGDTHLGRYPKVRPCDSRNCWDWIAAYEEHVVYRQGEGNVHYHLNCTPQFLALAVEEIMEAT